MIVCGLVLIINSHLSRVLTAMAHSCLLHFQKDTFLETSAQIDDLLTAFRLLTQNHYLK